MIRRAVRGGARACLLGAVLVALLAAELPTASGVGGPRAKIVAFYEQRAAWTACGGGFDCATVLVPLDYEDSLSPTIPLAVIRLKGTASRGSLIVNPGGPGASGVDLVRLADQVFTPRLLAEYDIVGFDPRGVGRSAPVNCLTAGQFDRFTRADWTPDTETEQAQLAVVAQSLGTGCARRSPSIAPHMSSRDAARDMDVIRAVLGSEKLNYLGWSYGTLLGAQYAELFPQNVGRFVLDGAMPNSATLEQSFLGMAAGLDAALRRFAADCVRHSDCPLSGTVSHAIAQIRGLLSRLDHVPIRGWQGRTLTESLATGGLIGSMSWPPISWDRLRAALAAAFDGDGEPLLAIADEAVGRDPVSGTYVDNSATAYFAVTCSDSPALGAVDHASRLAEQAVESAPVFGAYFAWLTLTCWQWAPRESATQVQPPARAVGSGPILVVATTHDPLTPYRDGVDVAEQLDNAVLLTLEGDGHTAYRRGSRCIDQAVDTFLISGVRPPSGRVCKLDR
jgi:pimeloyl-ACP methyl ester carboxylesterase